MIGVLVLAAGDGRRMGGGGKALLEVGGVSFLERVIRTSRDGGCDAVWVVTQAEQSAARNMVQSLGGQVVTNTAPERGMFSSVVDGLNSALSDQPEIQGFLIFPVDHPRVRAETVSALIQSISLKPQGTVAIPVYKARSGHPILVDSHGARSLAKLAPTTVFRDALQLAGLAPFPVEVPDPHIRENLNTPADLA